jgi:ABC-type transport system involved in cytochrome c biogenesis permease subunit
MITIAFLLQIVALVIQIAYLLFPSRGDDRVSSWVLIGSAGLLMAGFIARSIELNFFALTNTYESLVFFSFCVTVLIVVLRFLKRVSAPPILLFGGTLVSIVLLALASSPIAPSTLSPPVPALQSHWLVLHVSLSFVGEAFFVVSFVASVACLASRSVERKKLYDRLTYTSIAIGYPIFTAGALLFGAIWASYAWGAFWSWDPKETWALITWLTYTVYLHARLVRFGKAGKTGSGDTRRTLSAWLAIVGFLFTMFTFFGVNFLLSGLHSYR